MLPRVSLFHYKYMTLRLQGNLSTIKDKPCFTHSTSVMHLHLCHRLTSAPEATTCFEHGAQFEWEAMRLA